MKNIELQPASEFESEYWKQRSNNNGIRIGVLPIRFSYNLISIPKFQENAIISFIHQ